jgi:hypothetical protein
MSLRPGQIRKAERPLTQRDIGNSVGLYSLSTARQGPTKSDRQDLLAFTLLKSPDQQHEWQSHLRDCSTVSATTTACVFQIGELLVIVRLACKAACVSWLRSCDFQQSRSRDVPLRIAARVAGPSSNGD